MKIGVLIQARMSSVRLPGKMLLRLGGRTLLGCVSNRVAMSGLPLVVCTSEEESDAPLSDECQRLGIECFRGNLNDVAGRFLQAAKFYRFDGVVRISGDSPLICPELIQQGVSLFNDRCDLVSNVYPRTFPSGQSVEIFHVKNFSDIYQKMAEAEDFEHVTKYFYRNAEKFKILNFANSIDKSCMRMVIDTKEDYQKMSELFSKNPQIMKCDFKELVSLFEEGR